MNAHELRQWKRSARHRFEDFPDDCPISRLAELGGVRRPGPATIMICSKSGRRVRVLVTPSSLHGDIPSLGVPVPTRILYKRTCPYGAFGFVQPTSPP